MVVYVRESDDPGVAELLDFSKMYRAYVRGKVASFRLDDPNLPASSREEALEATRAYFRLAHSYVSPFPQPAVVLVAGLPGTGKTSVTENLARRWRMAHISSDVTRKTLAGVDVSEHRYAPFLEDIYSPHFSDLTYAAMLKEAEQHLQQGESIVLDATFRRAKERRRVIAMAQEMTTNAWVVECTLSEEEARHRLERRFEAGSSVSDGRWDLYHQQLAQWEPVTEVPPEYHILLNTGGSPQETMGLLLQGLYASMV